MFFLNLVKDFFSFLVLRRAEIEKEIVSALDELRQKGRVDLQVHEWHLGRFGRIFEELTPPYLSWELELAQVGSVVEVRLKNLDYMPF